MRLRFNYFTPDEVYETLVANLVTTETEWLDVGCGRDLFPQNLRLAALLSERSRLLFGVDPSPNVAENPFLDDYACSPIESFTPSRQFDLIILRMVAEHVTDPQTCFSAVAKLCRPGGTLVVYTINARSPVSLASWLTPFALHHRIKSLLWKTEERDTFPVAYRMNTRSALRCLSSVHGFAEQSFQYLDDCRTFHRFRIAHRCELMLRTALSACRLSYPENCLLGVYRRT